jgi:hypothetical protein
VLRLVERDRPEAVRRLQEWVLRVPALEHGTPSNADTDKVITAWCRELNLACKAIEDEALTMATGGKAPGDAASRDGDPEADYRIRWRPDESQGSYLRRALAEFRRHKHAEIAAGGSVASTEVNLQHVEWLVRFQVDVHSFDRIARTYGANRHEVKRAVGEIASVLQLTLRPTASRRPRGRRGPPRPAHRMVRPRR